MFLHGFVLLPMIIVIPKESTADERRVAIAPENVAAFTKLGYEVHVEAGAGVSAEMPDELYKEEGASIIEGKETIWPSGDMILKVNVNENKIHVWSMKPQFEFTSFQETLTQSKKYEEKTL